ncbi:MAG: SDR family oxidoreductase [Myxococcota bacterium]
MRLKGKRVLVLGASSGLGRTTAIAAAKEGAQVCLAARRTERIEANAREIGGDAFAIACDVRDEASCQALLKQVIERMGGLDALVYAPGIATFGPIEEVSEQSWHDVLGTNVVGLSLVLNAAIGALNAAQGKVVVYSSIVIDDSPPRPQQATYLVSKAALERLVEAWQGEHRAVGFTSIANGDTLTEFGYDQDVQKLGPIVKRWADLDYMYGRMMAAESVAEQAINAIASRETVRRIAITPSYPEAVEEGAYDAATVVEHARAEGAKTDDENGKA